MKILLVEDDRKVAGFIEQGLREEGHIVDVVPDGEEATMLAHVYDYDMILLDIVLPKKNGFQVASELRREGRKTPILMLTSRDAKEDVVRGLDAGADDYLAKPFQFDELLARIRALHRRGGAERLDLLRYSPIVLDRLRHSATINDKRLELTAKEFQLLEYFMLHPEEVVRAHAPGEGMGHALRPGEQRGGRPRGQSAPEADRSGGRTVADHDPRSGIQPEAGPPTGGDLARALARGYVGRSYILPAGALLFIVIGLLLLLSARSNAAAAVWSAGLVLTGTPVVWRTLRGMASGRFAADLVAMLAIVTSSFSESHWRVSSWC